MQELSHNWTEADFTKSSFSGNDPQACVEVAQKAGVIAVRNSTHPFDQGPIVEFTTDEWRAFVSGVLSGEFTF
jgi:hypothetical protein